MMWQMDKCKENIVDDSLFDLRANVEECSSYSTIYGTTGDCKVVADEVPPRGDRERVARHLSNVTDEIASNGSHDLPGFVLSFLAFRCAGCNSFVEDGFHVCRSGGQWFCLSIPSDEQLAFFFRFCDHLPWGGCSPSLPNPNVDHIDFLPVIILAFHSRAMIITMISEVIDCFTFPNADEVSSCAVVSAMFYMGQVLLFALGFDLIFDAF